MVVYITAIALSGCAADIPLEFRDSHYIPKDVGSAKGEIDSQFLQYDYPGGASLYMLDSEHGNANSERLTQWLISQWQLPPEIAQRFVAGYVKGLEQGNPNYGPIEEMLHTGELSNSMFPEAHTVRCEPIPVAKFNKSSMLTK